MISVNDLLRMGLTPPEFMAACFLLTGESGGTVAAPIDAVASVLECSPRTAKRVLAGLVDKGVIMRMSRGVFAFVAKGHQWPLDQPEGSPVAPRKYVQMDYMAVSHKSLVEPDGSTNSGGSAPAKGERRVLKMSRYDYENDGNDLAGFGLTETRRQTQRRDRKADLKYHRTVPRDQWDMAMVVKEFRHRILTDRKDLLGGGSVDSRQLRTVLAMWQRDHDLTPQQAADAVDKFFTDPGRVAALSTHNPNGVFLRFLQDEFPLMVAADLDDDWLASLDAQTGRFA